LTCPTVGAERQDVPHLEPHENHVQLRWLVIETTRRTVLSFPSSA